MLSQNSQHSRSKTGLATLVLLPIVIALWVWLSPLSFLPVPWPDDSAFYFVAKEFFKWPPRWVMLPQAPFEPTYRIFNFNTMPMYPILIGLGTFIGIDGSFWLKIWPLTAWALSGSLLGLTLYRGGLGFFGCFLIILAFAMDPELHWASVLVRPESLIGLFGMALVLGLTFGFPKRIQPKKLWDPISALLALSAYSHFNAIHLLWPVVFKFFNQPKRLLKIAGMTALYLSPWLILVLSHLNLFLTQMKTQWTRLAVGNEWLKNPDEAIKSFFQSLGNPEPWPDAIHWASVGMWLIVIAALLYGFMGIIQKGIESLQMRELSSKQQHDPTGLEKTTFTPSESFLHTQSHQENDPAFSFSSNQSISLYPAIGWLIGSIWLWHTKPEVWFVYYIHEAIWCFSGLAALKLYLHLNQDKVKILGALYSVITLITILFTYINLNQSFRLGSTTSWHWSTYNQLVDCVDERLIDYEKSQPSFKKPLKVWCPTFPDITIELSRRHPDWELTRTNDFSQKDDLAVKHGYETDVVVITETINWEERNISAPAHFYPTLQSSWMTWKEYFLNRLWTAKGWKQNRWICQKGRWQAFLFMEPNDKRH